VAEPALTDVFAPKYDIVGLRGGRVVPMGTIVARKRKDGSTGYTAQITAISNVGAAYTVTLSYVDRLTTLSGSSDANGWTNYAEELIRQRAKADILINQLRYPPAIQEAAAFGARGDQFLSGIEKGAYQNLRMESDDRVGTGRVRVRYL